MKKTQSKKAKPKKSLPVKKIAAKIPPAPEPSPEAVKDANRCWQNKVETRE